MNAPNPKIIDKLRALLAFAKDDRGNEHETNLAMEHAQRIMREHNLTMATIEARGGATESRSREANTMSLMFPWQRDLFTAVAKVNFCHFSVVYKTTRGHEQIGAGYEIIGRQSNVVSARNMYDYLTSSISRLIKEAAGPGQHGSKFAHSFRVGCAGRLQERLETRHDEQLRDQARKAREANATSRHPSSPTGNALVIVLEEFAQQEADLNNDVRRGWEPGTTAANRKTSHLNYLKAEEERKAKTAALISSGISADVASYMALGYSREVAKKFCKPQTEAQRRKDERKSERFWERQEAKDRRKRSRLDANGFHAGRSQAENIGLDTQVDHKSRKQLS